MDKLHDILNDIDAILDESAGEHGLFGRMALEKYKAEKKKNDENDAKVFRTGYQYVRAGYEDKIPPLSNRIQEDMYKNVYDEDKKIRNDRSKDNRVDYARRDAYGKASAQLSSTAKRIANEYNGRKERNDATVNKQLHDRINKRAQRTQNESTADILNDIDYLLNS